MEVAVGVRGTAMEEECTVKDLPMELQETIGMAHNMAIIIIIAADIPGTRVLLCTATGEEQISGFP